MDYKAQAIEKANKKRLEVLTKHGKEEHYKPAKLPEHDWNTQGTHIEYLAPASKGSDLDVQVIGNNLVEIDAGLRSGDSVAVVSFDIEGQAMNHAVTVIDVQGVGAESQYSVVNSDINDTTPKQYSAEDFSGNLVKHPKQKAVVMSLKHEN